uniref:DUF2785 domain-containing protein n=1 Tax=Rheinheimera sp. BAL341 TaxID=1708203 RepID=A0A486XKP9_9GAMM
MQRIFFLLLAVCFSAAGSENSGCNNQFSDQQLFAIKAEQFQPPGEEDINQAAIRLLACVGHSNPSIRDGVVYEAYQHWLRNNLLDTASIRQLFIALLDNLDKSASDPAQFRSAFSALILAEVVRVDRISPYLNTAEHQQAVDGVARFMAQITDYRGFDQLQGWRHSVAHTADIMLQLSLNPALTAAQADVLLKAIGQQVAPQQHFYHYGEPKRLALPVLYLLLNDKISSDSLTKHLQALAAPAPFSDWQQVYQHQHGLAKLHNTTAYFAALYILSSGSQNARLQTLATELAAILKTFN